MRPALLLILLFSVALVDGACLSALVARDTAHAATLSFLFGVLALHVGFAAAGGAGVIGLATELSRSRDGLTGALDRRAAIALGMLAFAFGVFLPALGAVGLGIALYLGMNSRRVVRERPWERLDPAEVVDVAPRFTAHRNVVVGELFAALSDRSPANAEHRFQVLLLTRFLPPRVAIRVLKVALKDPSDEVRLFAFSRIERFRSSIENNIKSLEQARTAGGDDMARVVLRLAENHWELAFLGLAEGAMRTYALEQARDRAKEAASLAPEVAPIHFMLGRILLALESYVPASASFTRAINLGYPRKRVVAYLAECAFRRREYDVVPSMLRELTNRPEEHQYLSPILDIWT